MVESDSKETRCERQASWLLRGIKVAPYPDYLNYSCGTAADLHCSFPVSSNGCSPLEPNHSYLAYQVGKPQATLDKYSYCLCI